MNKANKNHISLKTAKLLKDCGIFSKYHYADQGDNRKHKIVNYVDSDAIITTNNEKRKTKDYPAFTWQEILWEYPDKFFGEEEMTSSELSRNIVPHEDCNLCSMNRNLYYPNIILNLLQQKKYQEADDYFVEHCILTNK